MPAAAWWRFWQDGGDLDPAAVCHGLFQYPGADSVKPDLQPRLGIFYQYFFAFLIFAAAVFLVDLSRKKLSANSAREKFAYSRFLDKAISSTVWTLAGLAILYQLKIIAPLVLAVFVGIVIAVSLAVGVALGLGGKDIAAKNFKRSGRAHQK